jgi:putative methyltransferase (TIGR04325 family)
VGGIHFNIEITREAPVERLRAQLSEFRRTNIYFEGPLADWDTSLKNMSGYAAPEILDRAVASTRAVAAGEAAYERDTVLFQEPACSHPLLAWLLQAGISSGGELRVVDFGGALGSLYFQNRAAISVFKNVSWCVVEQTHFVEAGRKEFANESLSFSDDFQTAVREIGANVLILSGVVQYLENPRDFLRLALEAGINYIAIDRTMARKGLPDQVYLQHVPSWIYEATYPVWFLNLETLEQAFQMAGYETVERFYADSSRFGASAPLTAREFKGLNDEVGSLGTFDSWPYVSWFLRHRGIN